MRWDDWGNRDWVEDLIDNNRHVRRWLDKAEKKVRRGPRVGIYTQAVEAMEQAIANAQAGVRDLKRSIEWMKERKGEADAREQETGLRALAADYDRRTKTARDPRMLMAHLWEAIDRFEKEVKSRGYDRSDVMSAVNELRQGAHGVHRALSRFW